MANAKKSIFVASNRRLGILILLGLMAISFAVAMISISQVQTSTDTKAKEPKQKSACKGGVYQMSSDGNCYEMAAFKCVGGSSAGCCNKKVSLGKCGEAINRTECPGGVFKLDGDQCYEMNAKKRSDFNGVNQGGCESKPVSRGKCN